jgi:hypothetical protein
LIDVSVIFTEMPIISILPMISVKVIFGKKDKFLVDWIFDVYSEQPTVITG